MQSHKVFTRIGCIPGSSAAHCRHHCTAARDRRQEVNDGAEGSIWALHMILPIIGRMEVTTLNCREPGLYLGEISVKRERHQASGREAK